MLYKAKYQWEFTVYEFKYYVRTKPEACNVVEKKCSSKRFKTIDTYKFPYQVCRTRAMHSRLALTIASRSKFICLQRLKALKSTVC